MRADSFSTFLGLAWLGGCCSGLRVSGPWWRNFDLLQRMLVFQAPFEERFY